MVILHLASSPLSLFLVIELLFSFVSVDSISDDDSSSSSSSSGWSIYGDFAEVDFEIQADKPYNHTADWYS